MSEDLNELLENVRAAVQAGDASALSTAVDGVHAADIAEILPMLEDQEQSQLLYALPARTSAEVVIQLDDADRADVVDELDDKTLTDIVTALQPDDAADVLGALDDEQREELLERIGESAADKIEDLLEYDEESAGGIMTPELVALADTATVGEAIEKVRRMSEDEEIHYVYVVDSKKRLVGLVPLRRLVTNPHTKTLAEICDRDVVSVPPDEDQEDVARKIRKYDLSAIPVVDPSGRLLGRVTHDDVMDVAEEEAAEDLYYMAGTDAAELEEDSPARIALMRMRWLAACMMGTAISGTIIILFEDSFPMEMWSALFPFVPMMGAMGGNSGIQISTIIVRGIAVGDMASSRMGKSVVRELRIIVFMAPMCGLLAGLITVLGVHALQHFNLFGTEVRVSQLALSVGLGMTAAIAVASVCGMLMPHLFRRINVDPAIASGPIVTTTNDIVSVTAYFLIAWALMS